MSSGNIHVHFLQMGLFDNIFNSYKYISVAFNELLPFDDIVLAVP